MYQKFGIFGMQIYHLATLQMSNELTLSSVMTAATACKASESTSTKAGLAASKNS
jgi:hypothetical protein